MEINLCGLQETILEIVQVEEHAVHVKLRLRITIGEVQVSCSLNLDVRQFTDSTLQQLLFFQRISATSLPTASDGIKKRCGTEVCLQITQLIVGGSKDLGHRQLQFAEMLCQVDKGMILIPAGTHDAHHSLSVIIRQTVVGSVTAATGNLLNVGRPSPLPLPIKIQ